MIKVELGFSSVLFLTQIWHIFWPVGFYFSIAILGFGTALSSAILFSRKKSLFFEFKNLSRLKILIIMCAVVLCGCIAFRAMYIPTNIDSGSYHFNSIRWINEYPIVQGIGNLHHRFGYNQSFFAYVAILNLFPYFNHSHNIANSFFIIILLFECLFYSFRQLNLSFKEKAFIIPSESFSLIIIPIIIFHSFFQSISSPAPDILVFIIQLLLFTHLLKLIERDSYGQKISEVKLIFILSATAITCKLSIIVFASLISFISLLLLIYFSNRQYRVIFKSVMPSVYFSIIVICLWIFRGYLTNGCPFYPSKLFWIDTKWSVPLNDIQILTNWITSWSRTPNAHVDEVLNNWNWLIPWFYREFRKGIIYYPVLCFAVGLCLLLFKVSLLPKEKKIYHLSIFCTLFIPIIASLIFWFIIAPLPRYAGAMFWIMAILPYILFITLSNNYTVRRNLVLIALFLFIVPLWSVRHKFDDVSLLDFMPIPKVKLVKKTTSHGIDIYTAEKNVCWDSPLPSTPSFNKNLRLIGNDLSSGFTVKIKHDKSKSTGHQ